MSVSKPSKPTLSKPTATKSRASKASASKTSASKTSAPRAAGGRSYRPETQLVHGGTTRSQFGETSEALFLTQGFVYETAEQCEARFKGDEPGFLYSRFSNPTV